MDAFLQQGRSGIFDTETMEPTKLRMFAIFLALFRKHLPTLTINHQEKVNPTEKCPRDSHFTKARGPQDQMANKHGKVLSPVTHQGDTSEMFNEP